MDEPLISANHRSIILRDEDGKITHISIWLFIVILVVIVCIFCVLLPGFIVSGTCKLAMKPIFESVQLKQAHTKQKWPSVLAFFGYSLVGLFGYFTSVDTDIFM
jgi:hypothetical protein